MNLQEEYFKEYSRFHYVGMENYYYGKDNNLKLIDNTEISDSGFGTVWRMPYISRWIHEKTTLNHLEYIKNTAHKGYEEIANGKRYSINSSYSKKNFGII